MALISACTCIADTCSKDAKCTCKYPVEKECSAECDCNCNKEQPISDLNVNSFGNLNVNSFGNLNVNSQRIYKRIAVHGDGNCLFSLIVCAFEAENKGVLPDLKELMVSGLLLRIKVNDFLISARDYKGSDDFSYVDLYEDKKTIDSEELEMLQDEIEFNDSDERRPDLSTLRVYGQWASYCEMTAASYLLNMPIITYLDDNRPENGTDESLHIWYDGISHYEPFVKNEIIDPGYLSNPIDKKINESAVNLLIEDDEFRNTFKYMNKSIKKQLKDRVGSGVLEVLNQLGGCKCAGKSCDNDFCSCFISGYVDCNYYCVCSCKKTKRSSNRINQQSNQIGKTKRSSNRINQQSNQIDKPIDNNQINQPEEELIADGYLKFGNIVESDLKALIDHVYDQAFKRQLLSIDKIQIKNIIKYSGDRLTYLLLDGDYGGLKNPTIIQFCQHIGYVGSGLPNRLAGHFGSDITGGGFEFVSKLKDDNKDLLVLPFNFGSNLKSCRTVEAYLYNILTLLDFETYNKISIECYDINDGLSELEKIKAALCLLFEAFQFSSTNKDIFVFFSNNFLKHLPSII